MLSLKIIEKLEKIFHKITSWLRKGDNLVYLEFFVISLFIFGPLLVSKGYVFALDMSFTPKLRIPTELNSYFVSGTLLWFFDLFLPSFVIQKVLLLAVPFLAGVGMYRLVDTKSIWPRYFAAFLYIFNPFTYSRFLYGQLLILLAYALTPFAIAAILNFFIKTDRRSALRVAVWLIIVTLVDYHITFFILLFFGVYGFLVLIRNIRNWQALKKIVSGCLLIVIIFILVNSFWLAPLLFGDGGGMDNIKQSVDNRHITAFRTVSDAKLGVFWNTAALYGFWGDRGGRYIVQKNVVPYWFEVFLFILALVVWGIVSTLFLNKKYKFFSRNKMGHLVTIVVSLLVIGLFSWFFAIGIASPQTKSIAQWIYDKIPLFRGYREPQKFISLVVLSYAYLGAWGVNNLIILLKASGSGKLVSKIIFHSAVVAMLALPLLYSPGLLNSFGGQLYNSNYPTSWFTINDVLNKDHDDFKVLFLPWHGYLSFPFTGNRVIGNPAENFFDKPVIAGDNLEMGQIYTQSSRSESKYIEEVMVFDSDKKENLARDLAKINIKYIILARVVDYKSYLFLDESEDWDLFFRSSDIIVYLNKQWQPYE